MQSPTPCNCLFAACSLQQAMHAANRGTHAAQTCVVHLLYVSQPLLRARPCEGLSVLHRFDAAYEVAMWRLPGIADVYIT